MTEIRVPDFPECAEPCKACDSGDGRRTVYVVEVPVAAGDAVEAGALLAVVETNKTTLEVTAPHPGTVAEVMVSPGDELCEGDLLINLI